MSHRGAGDLWLAGLAVPGVAFALNDAVRLVSGPLRGQHGRIAMLMALAPEPTYLVTLSDGRDVRSRQSELARS